MYLLRNAPYRWGDEGGIDPPDRGRMKPPKTPRRSPRGDFDKNPLTDNLWGGIIPLALSERAVRREDLDKLRGSSEPEVEGFHDDLS